MRGCTPYRNPSHLLYHPPHPCHTLPGKSSCCGYLIPVPPGEWQTFNRMHQVTPGVYLLFVKDDANNGEGYFFILYYYIFLILKTDIAHLLPSTIVQEPIFRRDLFKVLVFPTTAHLVCWFHDVPLFRPRPYVGHFWIWCTAKLWYP